MMSASKIRLLPEAVANQIAAGEVVQRPASVVKELLENALDAGATHIKVLIEEGGKSLIQVIDDGCGMSAADAKMCFERHATSKITQVADLFQLYTYGFRGEALASIAAVAQVELVTKEPGAELGTRMVVSGSHITEEGAVHAPAGTNIAVRYLFGNVPARRNFLKSTHLETKYIIEEFQHAALAKPQVRFDLYQNNKPVYQLPVARLSHRIVHLFGESYQQQLIPCSEETGSLKLSGYIGTPRQAKKTRGGQFFFVNGRYIRSSYLHHAVKQGFEGLILADTIPFYVLFIEVHPDRIDVNVHPAKTEVRFDHEALVYALVSAGVKKTLARYHLTPPIDFEQPDNQAIVAFSAPQVAAGATPPFAPPYCPPGANPAEQEQQGAFALQEQEEGAPPVDVQEEHKEYTTPKHLMEQEEEEPAKTKLQLHKKYIITSVKSGMLVIEQEAAFERILYERNIRDLRTQPSSTQQLLFPVRVALQPADLVLLQDCQEALYQLGFRFHTVEGNTVVITSEPAAMSNSASEATLLALLEQYKAYVKDLGLDKGEAWARALAKRGSKALCRTLTPRELDSIVDELFSCENPNYTPEGRHVWQIVPTSQLSELFLWPRKE